MAATTLVHPASRRSARRLPSDVSATTDLPLLEAILLQPLAGIFVLLPSAVPHGSDRFVKKHAPITGTSEDVAGRMCGLGHEWPAVVYSRTLSKTGCPDCAALTHPAEMKAAAKKRRQEADERAEAQIRSVTSADELALGGEF